MTSTQLAESSKFGASITLATDATEHRDAVRAAIARTFANREQYAAQQARSARHAALLASVTSAFCA